MEKSSQKLLSDFANSRIKKTILKTTDVRQTNTSNEKVILPISLPARAWVTSSCDLMHVINSRLTASSRSSNLVTWFRITWRASPMGRGTWASGRGLKSPHINWQCQKKKHLRSWKTGNMGPRLNTDLEYNKALKTPKCNVSRRCSKKFESYMYPRVIEKLLTLYEITQSFLQKNSS